MGALNKKIAPNRKRIRCNACKKMIEIGENKYMHHISYHPEIIVPVHASCHAKIHHGSDYQHLIPDPRQLIRFYYRHNIFLENWERDSSITKHTFSKVVPKFFKKIERLSKYYKRLESKIPRSNVKVIDN